MLCNSNFSQARRPLQLTTIHNFRQYLRRDRWDTLIYAAPTGQRAGVCE